MRLRLGNFMIPLPRMIWQRAVAREGRAARAHLRFMTDDHHRVRNFVVEELPRAGAPLAPELVAERLELPVDSVVRILEKLERKMTFLFRNPAGAVEWAYPITVADTPFRYLLDSGETMTPA